MVGEREERIKDKFKLAYLSNGVDYRAISDGKWMRDKRIGAEKNVFILRRRVTM